VVEYPFGLDARNALDIVPKYDVVVDASDNVATRYLVSDACVVANRPLVSGAALGMEGQLTVYNYSEVSFCFIGTISYNCVCSWLWSLTTKHCNCRGRATDACFQLHLRRQHVNDAQMLVCLVSSQGL
jgi:hypothetical protein